jgi:glycosyltransferase involved in cell wall biosynthesis
MRILQVVNVRWFNATAWYALGLSRLLADAGHRVLVAVLPGTDTESTARDMGLDPVALDVNSVNPVRLFAGLIRMIALLRVFQPEVVNCHRGEGFFLWCLLKPFFDFKLVRTRGDQRPPRGDFLNRWLHGRVADAVVVTNSRMARHFLEEMRTPEERLWLIRGGVDETRFRFDPKARARVRREFGFTDGEFVVGLLGRFDRVKGQRQLIEAVAEAYRGRGVGNLRLLLVGFSSATDQSEVEAWIEAQDIGAITRITGRRDDVPALLSALDLGVVASLFSETIARAALEIMAADRPLVSTDVGVMPDLVSAKALVPAGDVPALAEALARAAADPAFCRELVREQASVLSQLTDREFLKRTMGLYESLAQG